MTTLQSIVAAATAAGAGVWLLNDAQVSITYDRGDELATLDLQDAGRIIVIRLVDVDSTAPAGLTTLQPAPGYCRICGCSQWNACETDAGSCGWSEEDLCTGCTGEGVEA